MAARDFSSRDLRHAAGLLLLFPVDDRAHVVLTVRAHTLDRHGGQVSLPGGVVEAGETFEQAALREAHEEIALELRRSEHSARSRRLISRQRFSPASDRRDRRTLGRVLRPRTEKSARILEVSIDDLLDSRRIVWRTMTRDGGEFRFPAFPLMPTRKSGAPRRWSSPNCCRCSAGPAHRTQTAALRIQLSGLSGIMHDCCNDRLRSSRVRSPARESCHTSENHKRGTRWVPQC